MGLYVLQRGTLRSELLMALRQARKARRPRARGTDRRGQILHMTPMTERPAEVATRTVPGHWDGNLHFSWNLNMLIIDWIEPLCPNPHYS